jgi:hypothetical protein
MSRLLAALLILGVASPCFADDEPRTLNAKEAANGTLMMFDGVTTFGWQVEGSVTIKDGWMIVGGDKATTITCTTSFLASFIILKLAYDDNLPKEKLPVLSLNKGNVIQGPGRGKIGYPGSEKIPSQIRLTVPAGTTVKVGDVWMSPQKTTKLFNGKDLDGWKINAADPKRMASKWEVTKDGELSVKNGPGDLVTEKEFDNFVMQLECKTNGKALNSGVFFRCIPGQYQNGYEAQIQNAYKDNDRTKPVDFGTGAIYRRVPARKVVSNDNEWFTMTVVADGKHISTWVNGYQTVDWIDDRKENENPRQGYRAAKGPISIQGHDPTTDILFRNIRITELPAK